MFEQAFQKAASDFIWQEHVDPGDGNVLGVGFGIGLKKNEPDLSRPTVVRLYVANKRDKNSRAQRRPLSEIDRHVTVPVLGERESIKAIAGQKDFHGRTLTPPTLRLPTDVYEVGTLVGSGALTAVTGDPSLVTAGAIVRWQQLSDRGTFRWGVITVAHGFDPPIAPNVALDTSIQSPQTGEIIHGKRLVQLKPPFKGFDTVLIRVNPKDLTLHGLLTSTQTSNIPTMRYEHIGLSEGAAGVAFQRGRLVYFSVVGNVSPLSFQGVGTVDRLVHVRAASEDAFIRTTSGSVLALLSPASRKLVPAALQIGADSETGFRDGYGQCLRDAIRNLTSVLNARLQPDRDRVVGTLNLVSYF